MYARSLKEAVYSRERMVRGFFFVCVRVCVSACMLVRVNAFVCGRRGEHTGR